MKDLCKHCAYKDDLAMCLHTACPYLDTVPARVLREMLQDMKPKEPECSSCKNYERIG